MLVNDIDPIRKKIVVKIHNYDKHVNFSALKIRQQLLSHAEFEFFWRISDKITTEPLEDFESFKKFFGAEVMFSFFNFVTQKEMLFKGLIDNMEIRNQDGASAGFLVKGHSHTIAMEDLKYSRMHLGRTLQEIVAESLKGQAVGMWEIEDIAPANNQIIASSLQSNEHGWKYICRLARNFGEWLYWDGTRLQFGRLKDSKMVLVNGVHLKSFGMGSRLVSNKSSYSGYDYEAGALIEGQLEKTDDNFNDSLMNTSLNAQKLQFIRKMDREIPFHSYSSNAQHQSDIDQMNKLDAAGKAAMMVTYSVESHVPVYVGHIVTVKNKTVDHVMIVTKSEITSIGVGNLVCRFEAIPADAKHPPYTNSEKHGKAKAQPAVVLDNNDPAGMGRVRVKYFWGKSDNESDWLRVQTVHGGSGKGFYFIPEIGEEVRVSFEGGNPDRGFVSGSNFNGKEISGYSDSGNNVKAIHTRSGTKILLNDKEGSVFIEDPSGNTWLMDGKGNIGVNAPKRLTLNAADIEMNAYNNLEINVGNNMIMNVMTKLFVFTPQLQQIVSGFMSLFSGKALINSSDIIDIEAKELNAVGTKKMFIHSDEKAVINSKGVAEMHGKSGNKLSNQAKSIVVSPPEGITNVIVEFRPSTTYKGEFGFDWLRINDNGLATEPAYDTIIDSGYEAPNGVAPHRDANTKFELGEAFSKLEKEYNPTVVSRPTGSPTKYYVPWLNLYPESVSNATTTPVGLPKPPFEAELMILIDIEGPDEPDQIRVVFDKRYFTIDGKDGTDVNPVLITEKTVGPKRKGTATLKIKCIDQFATNQDIKVYAYPKGSLALSPAVQLTRRKLAGKITACANMKDATKGISQRKSQKILIVNVITNIQGSINRGLPNPSEKEILQNALHQALIHGFIEDYTDNGGFLDLTNVNEFKILTDASGRKTYGKYIYEKLVKDPIVFAADIAAGRRPNSTDGLLYEDYPGKGMFIFLKERFLSQPGNRAKYAGHFLVFAFNDRPYDYYAFPSGGYTTTTGQVQDIGIKTVCLFDAALRGDFTLHHEALHGLGLDHTHDDGQFLPRRKYTFQRYETTNVMSYADATHPDNTKITTWKWQWKILKSNAQ